MALNSERCDCALCSQEDSVSESVSLASQTQAEDEQPSITPLPKLQLLIIIFIQVAEPVTSTVIYPFVNDLVRALGITHGDEKKTGYYVGLIESIFYAAEALTVLQWGRASDMIGRRPILLGGMLGLSLSMLGFGLSKSYWMLILSRCAQGAFNGNIGVTKSVMAEITDATNAPQAFSFLPVAWSIGSTLGPLVGGTLAGPVERWPAAFGAMKFFKDYPYFLPCIVATSVPLFAFLFAFLGLKETLPSAVERQSQIEALKLLAEADEAGSPIPTSRLLQPSICSTQSYGATTANGSNTSTPTSPTKSTFAMKDTSPPPPFRELLIASVLIPITNFAFLAFLDQSMLVLLPLIYSTPLDLGGLGLSPSMIGTILGVWGVINGIIQVSCFAWVRKHLGQRSCYMLGIAGLGVCFALFPVLARLAAWDGGKVGPWVWLGIMLQLTAYMFSYMSYACMFMYIAAAAPSRSSLGATNGLAQLTVSGVRALAPSTASSLFSFSLELLHGRGSTIGGYLVYLVLCSISAAALGWSFLLPKSLEEEQIRVDHRRDVTESTIVS
ncbi:Protein ZINC INDUCED FACILITATOR-LIKE 1 [Hypsizygus marmoreus]|uniref:Protein ZINC INDUCED FACILITATOR-LIKE 1 n=1 Tax=Hypsizygus marmoreus TaxID=39966 RepID=A0A369JWL4_HYPMA|nr:Protein ZINC INDUCED FACILITATOR-LIKE 1 [Hypsizygus marmoreus]